MATFQEVKAFIDDKIKDNENGEITGNVLNEALTLLLNVKAEDSGGLELRELKMSGTEEDNAYNLETLELMKENKVLPAMDAGDGTLVPLTYGGNGMFSIQVAQEGIEVQMMLTMAENGRISVTQDTLAPLVLLSPTYVLKWIRKNYILAQFGSYESAYVVYNGQFCIIDYVRATTGDNSKKEVQFNYGNKRFERIYNANTGEEISTTEIPIGSGGGGGGGSITLDSEMSDTSENAVSNKVIKEYVDNAAPHQFGEDFSEDFN